MKLEIDPIVNPQAAGPARGTCAIVPGVKGPRDVTHPGVAFVVMGEGRIVRMVLSAPEARCLGEMLIVCGAVAEGGPPPVLAPDPPASPLIINNGRH